MVSILFLLVINSCCKSSLSRKCPVWNNVFFLNKVLYVNTRLCNRRKFWFFENLLNDNFILKRKNRALNRSFFIHYLGLFYESDKKNHLKYWKICCKCPHRSAKEQLVCYNIKEVRLWKSSMLLSIIQVSDDVIVLIINRFTIISLKIPQVAW
jgi:hypothetical protein